MTFRVQFGCSNDRIPYVKDGTGLENCQVELRFTTCACVYRPEKDVPGSFISQIMPY